jgi:hypothetical protein
MVVDDLTKAYPMVPLLGQSSLAGRYHYDHYRPSNRGRSSHSLSINL